MLIPTKKSNLAKGPNCSGWRNCQATPPLHEESNKIDETKNTKMKSQADLLMTLLEVGSSFGDETHSRTDLDLNEVFDTCASFVKYYYRQQFPYSSHDDLIDNILSSEDSMGHDATVAAYRSCYYSILGIDMFNDMQKVLFDEINKRYHNVVTKTMTFDDNIMSFLFNPTYETPHIDVEASKIIFNNNRQSLRSLKGLNGAVGLRNISPVSIAREGFHRQFMTEVYFPIKLMKSTSEVAMAYKLRIIGGSLIPWKHGSAHEKLHKHIMARMPTFAMMDNWYKRYQTKSFDNATTDVVMTSYQVEYTQDISLQNSKRRNQNDVLRARLERLAKLGKSAVANEYPNPQTLSLREAVSGKERYDLAPEVSVQQWPELVRPAKKLKISSKKYFGDADNIDYFIKQYLPDLIEFFTHITDLLPQLSREVEGVWTSVDGREFSTVEHLYEYFSYMFYEINQTMMRVRNDSVADWKSRSFATSFEVLDMFEDTLMWPPALESEVLVQLSNSGLYHKKSALATIFREILRFNGDFEPSRYSVSINHSFSEDDRVNQLKMSHCELEPRTTSSLKLYKRIAVQLRYAGRAAFINEDGIVVENREAVKHLNRMARSFSLRPYWRLKRNYSKLFDLQPLERGSRAKVTNLARDAGLWPFLKSSYHNVIDYLTKKGSLLTGKKFEQRGRYDFDMKGTWHTFDNIGLPGHDSDLVRVSLSVIDNFKKVREELGISGTSTNTGDSYYELYDNAVVNGIGLEIKDFNAALAWVTGLDLYDVHDKPEIPYEKYTPPSDLQVSEGLNIELQKMNWNYIVFHSLNTSAKDTVSKFIEKWGLPSPSLLFASLEQLINIDKYSRADADMRLLQKDGIFFNTHKLDIITR